MKEGQTFGQWLKWDFEANGDLGINDKNGNSIYFEASNGFWERSYFYFLIYFSLKNSRKLRKSNQI